MQPFKIIILLVLIALVAVFTFQNTQAVEVQLYFWSFSLSISLLLITTFTVGVLAGMLLMLVNSILRTRQTKAAGAKNISLKGKDSLWDS